MRLRQRAIPKTSTSGMVGQNVLCQVAPGESRDPCDQYSHLASSYKCSHIAVRNMPLMLTKSSEKSKGVTATQPSRAFP